MDTEFDFENRIVTTDCISEDGENELSLRPHTLEEYVGQAKSKDILKIYIEAAKLRGECLDHVLLYGPPGLGKTTLSAIIAAELGVNLRVTSGPAIEKQGDETATALKQLDIEEKQLEIELALSLRKLEMEQLISELAALEEDIAKNVLYAPFDGRVVYMSADWRHGDYVSAFTPLVYLADDTKLFVESEYMSNSTLNLAHAIYAQIDGGQYALTPTPVDEKKYLAQVLSGESLVRQFTFDNPDAALEAGQYAAVCLESSYRENALLVPTNCLYSGDKTRYLYVMEDGVRVRRDVKVGVSTDWYTQITEGLQEGELVYVKE